MAVATTIYLQVHPHSTPASPPPAPTKECGSMRIQMPDSKNVLSYACGEQSKDPLRYVVYFGCGGLLAAWSVLWVFAQIAFLQFGHWPTYNNPEPVHVTGHQIFRIMFIVLVAGSIVALCAAMAVAIAIDSRRSAGTVVAAIILFVAATFLDPGGIFDWYLD
jgi:hypothetical protein